jgi:DNA-binding XRE family transcriptional regulator
MLSEPELVRHAQFVLGLSQDKFAQLMGVSRRTVTRWTNGDSYPNEATWMELARHVHRRDRDVAARIASALKESLVSLGLEDAPPPPPPQEPQPPPRPYPPTGDLVDSVVCAAAEAVAMTPQAIRPALVSAFDRFASVGLGLDEMRAGLSPSPPITPGARRRSTKGPNPTRSPRPQRR